VVCSSILLAKYSIGARKIVVKLSPVNLTNILRAAFSPIFVGQKIQNQTARKRKAVQNTFVQKTLLKLSPELNLIKLLGAYLGA